MAQRRRRHSVPFQKKKRWNEEDVKILLKLHRDGKTAQVMARELKRTECATTQKLRGVLRDASKCTTCAQHFFSEKSLKIHISKKHKEESKQASDDDNNELNDELNDELKQESDLSDTSKNSTPPAFNELLNENEETPDPGSTQNTSTQGGILNGIIHQFQKINIEKSEIKKKDKMLMEKEANLKIKENELMKKQQDLNKKKKNWEKKQNESNEEITSLKEQLESLKMKLNHFEQAANNKNNDEQKTNTDNDEQNGDKNEKLLGEFKIIKLYRYKSISGKSEWICRAEKTMLQFYHLDTGKISLVCRDGVTGRVRLNQIVPSDQDILKLTQNKKQLTWNAYDIIIAEEDGNQKPCAFAGKFENEKIANKVLAMLQESMENNRKV